MVKSTEVEIVAEETAKTVSTDNDVKDIQTVDLDVDIIEIKQNVPDKEPVLSELDLYKAALQYEEVEVARRPAEGDQKLFLGTCASVRTLMQEILALKQPDKQPENWTVEVEDRRVQIMMKMLNMRKLSRTQKVRVRLAREEALEARQNVDCVTLQLQGLLYEVLQLQKEATRCMQLATAADKDIELMPLQQFYDEAPKDISRPEVTMTDAHQQRLARLHWELEQRRGQTTLSDTLTLDQESVQQQILQQEDKLAALAPRITAILQSTLPLQEALQLPLSAQAEQQNIAQLLPLPLYTLWMQTLAYGEAGDPLISTIIRGDVDAAKATKQRQVESAAAAAAVVAATAANDIAATFSSAAIDSDNEDSRDGTPQTRERGGRTGPGKNGTAKEGGGVAPVAGGHSTATVMGEAAAQLLTLHPLHVEVTIAVQAGGGNVVVQFHYASELRVVTLRSLVVVKDTPTTPQLVVDVLSSPDFLDCLFEDDDGLHSPNPATVHQLRHYYASRPVVTTTGAPSRGLGAAIQPITTTGPSRNVLATNASTATGSSRGVGAVGGVVSTPPKVAQDVDSIPWELGRSYKWAQSLAGVSFPPLKQGENSNEHATLATMAQEIEAESSDLKEGEIVSMAVSSGRVHVTVTAIRRRLRSRIILQQHLNALHLAKTTSAIPVSPTSVSAHFPVKVSSELTEWRALSWREYSSLPTTGSLRDAGLATAQSRCFRAHFQRKHVTLLAYVCVPVDYPQSVPLFALDLKWGQLPVPHAHLQQLEAEVNVHWPELAVAASERVHLLPLLLYRLASCLDVYTEAASCRLADGSDAGDAGAAGNLFQKEKIFFRPARGPDRAFPLKYLPKLGVFAQR